MFLKDGGKDGPASGPSDCVGSRPSRPPSSGGETLWLIRSCCIRSFTELPEGDLFAPSERAYLGLPEEESEG